jgi:TRAP-type C4-dicarboxylate transport system permease large subunit
MGELMQLMLVQVAGLFLIIMFPEIALWLARILSGE